MNLLFQYRNGLLFRTFYRMNKDLNIFNDLEKVNQIILLLGRFLRLELRFKVRSRRVEKVVVLIHPMFQETSYTIYQYMIEAPI
jgi:hypothetical protein